MINRDHRDASQPDPGRTWRGFIVGAGAALLVATPAAAQVVEPLGALLACRTLPDGPQRLACFDRQAAAVSTAIDARDLVVTDRAQRAALAKNDFGRPVGATGATARNDATKATTREPIPARIDATIARAAQLASGRWSIVLDTGARWQQADDRIFARDPRAGMKITITRAALGSYLGKVDGQIAVRLRRVD